MPARRRKNEEGALLIILMVGVTVTMIGLAVAFQTWSTVWRRDNEEELIFRGQQYVDAIRAYQKDHAKQCPLNLEELMKPGPRQVRYIRKLFRDPMKKGAKWGLLYVMPGGNAIYDPVAAQKAQKDSGWGDGQPKDDNSRNLSAGSTQPGVTPITRDPGGAVPGMGPGGPTGRVGRGGNVNVGVSPQTQPGMALPPPRPASDSDDEKDVSEPPIGWPIAGVITRVIDMETGKVAGETPTFKVYRGHEHADEWQFHVFDQGNEMAQAPNGTLPGGSPPPFIGPGFGGNGPINGMGNGARPNFQGGMGGRGGQMQQGGGMQPGGGQGTNPWTKPRNP